MICGMLEPDGGSVFLSGIEVTSWPMYRRAREGGMGYLAQEKSVFGKLTTEQNLLCMLELLGTRAGRDGSGATNCCDNSTSSTFANPGRRSSLAANDVDWKSHVA